jgi:hypothetical protein
MGNDEAGSAQPKRSRKAMDLEASRKRSLATVRRTMRKVENVIAMSRDLARDHPDHRESAEQRIREGEGELRTLREEERKLTEDPFPPGG